VQRGSYGYPDPTGLTPAGASPASSTASFYSTQPQPYYPPQPARASPQSAYSYDLSRASSSPHTLGQPGTPAPPGTIPYYDGRTPPPGMVAASSARSGVGVNELVGAGSQSQQQYQQQQYQAAQLALKQQEERTSTDTSMVQALSRGPK
jgi:hypothetical protein